MNIRMIKFTIMGDQRGSLIALEEDKNIPFTIKRVYYIFDTTEDVRRGCHAHRNLEQVLICINGGCRILMDDGENREFLLLNDCSAGLYIGKMIWREMFDFSSDCILMVLASEYYDENDYIRNYEGFLSEIR